jgi:glutamyl-tRNA reductase
MKLSITGLNHTTAPVEVRERLAIDEGALAEMVGELRSLPGMHEGLILSTCNRVEVAVTSEDSVDAHDSVNEFLARRRSVSPSWLKPYLYCHDGREAIRHLFRVAASLDSMVVGEPQILGQMKAAFEAAKSQGAIGGFLETVLTRAFRAAKRIRTETEIGQSAVSISYAAVELARQIFGSLDNRHVLLLGAGKMSVLAARHLARAGAASIHVTNRSPERAARLAAAVQGHIADYTNFTATLPTMDVVIASSAAPHYVLSKEMMRGVMASRRNRPVFLIDIAVPRNIDPAVNEIDGVFLYDIDDLQKVVDRNKAGRQEKAAGAERIVEVEVERLVLRLNERHASQDIVTLQNQLEQLRAGEVERFRARLGELTPQQEEALQAITRGIINKIAHAPITELRKHAGDLDNANVLELIRRLFRLEP